MLFVPSAEGGPSEPLPGAGSDGASPFQRTRQPGLCQTPYAGPSSRGRTMPPAWCTRRRAAARRRLPSG